MSIGEKIDLTDDKNGGVIKIIKKEGYGEETANKGVKAEVDYTGRLLDGTVFDSSLNHGQKFKFNVGQGQVIKAWDLCVGSMKRGEKCEVTCKAKYAYGSRGSPPKIPPNADLVFDIELYDWEGEDITDDKDKGVLKEIIEEATDSVEANAGSFVDVTLVGKFGDKVFDEQRKTFTIDEDDDDLIVAIPLACKTMKTNEQCRITVAPNYAFGTEGSEKLGVPANATVTYDITMNSLERCKETWEMDDAERLAESFKCKERGTAMLKEKKYAQAEKLYNRCVETLSYLDAKETGTEEQKDLVKRAQNIRMAGYLNLALCQNHSKKYADVVQSCSKVLEIDAANEKALFRQGQAQMNQNMFHEARSSFERAFRVNHKNKAAFNSMNQCKAEIKRQVEREKNTFKGMFDKFVQQDEREDVRQKIKSQEEKAKLKAEKKAAAAANEGAGDVDVD